MTKIYALVLNALVRALTCFLPRWKRLTARARAYDRLRPFEDVFLGGSSVRLFIPDRTSVYWAKVGPSSEPRTNAWIASFSCEDTLIDIGANIGLYSLLAATHGVSKVYACEPNPFSFAVLARNVVENGLSSRIVPLCLAMSSETSMVTFGLSGTQAGSIGNEISASPERTSGIRLDVAAFSVDEFVRIMRIGAINHVKIDVDGLELEILYGATETLSDLALKSILVEDNSRDRDGDSELVAFLRQFGLHPSTEWGEDASSNKIFVRKT